MLRALYRVTRAVAALAAPICLLAVPLALAPRVIAQQASTQQAQPAAATLDRPIELFPAAAASHADLLFQPGQSFTGEEASQQSSIAADLSEPPRMEPVPAGPPPAPTMPAPITQAIAPYVPPLTMPAGPGPHGVEPQPPFPWQGDPHPLLAHPPQEMLPRGVHPASHQQPPTHQQPLPAGIERSALSGGAVIVPQAMPISAAFNARQEELPPPAEPQGEIVLTEEPGMVLGPTCFDCPNCGGPGCYPGRTHCCSACTAHTRWGRFWCAIYETICCPDPCWDPTYLPIADSAFFVPTARPTTMTRFRWDAGFSMVYPDRAEFFWAQADGSGLGPKPVAPYKGERGLDYDELSMYTEAAVNNFAMTFEMPYRSVDPLDGSIEAGFSDMIIGTKSLVFDRELIQISFQFRTFIPSGKAMEGLGTGHVSLEPSIIVGFKLSPESYLQAQIAEWIPLGASTYAGSILHYHVAYNHTLFYMLPDVPIVGTAEVNGWSFQDGSYTDPYVGRVQANDHTYLSGALGLRMFICNWLDGGMAANFAFGSPNWTQELYRLECRIRF